MQAAVSLLTAAAVMLHLLLGCCGHSGCANPPPVKQVAETPVKHSCCRHGHSHSAPVQQENPRDSVPAERCNHGDCSFSDSTPEVAAPVSGLVAKLELPTSAEIARTAWSQVDSAPLAPLPCRLHLWNGVFLI